MKSTTKTIRVSEEKIMKIEIITIVNKTNFNAFINFCIDEQIKKHNLDKEKFLSNETEEEKEINKHLFLRIKKSAMDKLKIIAKKKGSTITKEARFRLLATLYDDVYEPSELRKLQIFLNEIKKIGRFLNTSIQQNLLIKTDMVERINKRLNGIEAVLTKIIYDNRLRNKNYEK